MGLMLTDAGVTADQKVVQGLTWRGMAAKQKAFWEKSFLRM